MLILFYNKKKYNDMEVKKEWYGTSYKIGNNLKVGVHKSKSGYAIVVDYNEMHFISLVKDEPDTSNIKSVAKASVKEYFEKIQRCYKESMAILKDDE